MFRVGLREQVRRERSGIREELLHGDGGPSPVRRVEIPKPNSVRRMLGNTTVKDRLIQQALGTGADAAHRPGAFRTQMRVSVSLKGRAWDREASI